MILTGFVIGVVSAAICLLSVIWMGIVKQIFSRIRTKMGENKFLREVVPPTIGGAVIGECFLCDLLCSVLICCNVLCDVDG